MLIWEKIKNACANIGYSRAAAHLAQQGRHDLAKELMLAGIKEIATKDRAIKRLEKVRAIKSSYEPGDHYMRGKKVAFWRGHANG